MTTPKGPAIPRPRPVMRSSGRRPPAEIRGWDDGCRLWAGEVLLRSGRGVGLSTSTRRRRAPGLSRPPSTCRLAMSSTRRSCPTPVREALLRPFCGTAIQSSAAQPALGFAASAFGRAGDSNAARGPRLRGPRRQRASSAAIRLFDPHSLSSMANASTPRAGVGKFLLRSRTCD